MLLQSAEHCEMSDSESEYKFNLSSIVITVIKSLGSRAFRGGKFRWVAS